MNAGFFFEKIAANIANGKGAYGDYLDFKNKNGFHEVRRRDVLEDDLDMGGEWRKSMERKVVSAILRGVVPWDWRGQVSARVR